MKKLLLNANLFILLLAPIFVIMAGNIFYRTINLELPDVQTEITGVFNKKTIFQVLYEIVKNQTGSFVSK